MGGGCFLMKVRAACRVVCCLWPARRRLSLFSGLNPSLLPHSSERLSFSAAPPSPSLSHSWMMKTPLAVFQTADKRSLSPSAFKNERITCLKQQQPSFSTPPPHGTKAIRKHTHTPYSNFQPPAPWLQICHYFWLAWWWAAQVLHWPDPNGAWMNTCPRRDNKGAADRKQVQVFDPTLWPSVSKTGWSALLPLNQGSLWRWKS